MTTFSVFFSELSQNQNKSPIRLDAYLSTIGVGCSRREAGRLCDERKVKINSRTAKRGAQVQHRDEILVDAVLLALAPSASRLGSPTEDLPIVYEDSEVLIISKPRAMHSVLQRSEDPYTVADFLASKSAEFVTSSPSKLESGLVQRLDYYTSGLITAAKNNRRWHELHDGFCKGDFTKFYAAFTHKTTLRPGAVLEEGLFVDDVQNLGAYSLVYASTNLGSRHIVRRVLAESGSPLVGDDKFGAKEKTFPVLKDGKVKFIEGFFLHAYRLSGPFGVQGKQLSVDDAHEFSLSEQKGTTCLLTDIRSSG